MVHLPRVSGTIYVLLLALSLTVPTTPAILNAIYDAVGVRITQTPATPERVFQAIQEARARGEFEE